MKMKSNFFKRLVAYLIDIIIVVVVASLITNVIPKDNKYQELLNEQTSVMKKYMDKEIDYTVYIESINNISYDVTKNSWTNKAITFVIYVLYFIIFQLVQKGQTIGKRIMNIRLKSKDGNLKVGQVVLRSGIINNIFLSLLTLFAIKLLDKKTFLLFDEIISVIFYVFILISVFMIIYRKDKEGLHDIITKTEVLVESGE